jgi:hypothetical protein
MSERGDDSSDSENWCPQTNQAMINSRSSRQQDIYDGQIASAINVSSIKE